MRETERRKLNVFEMKCLRSMAGVSLMDRVRNEVVRMRTGVRGDLATTVDMNVLRWFGHVERMENDRLLKRVMNAEVSGRGARGRPIVRRETADFWKESANGDTSMKFYTDILYITLIENQPRATWNSSIFQDGRQFFKMAALQINMRQMLSFVVYNSFNSNYYS